MSTPPVLQRVAILGAGDLGRTLVHHARATGHLVPACFLDDIHAGETRGELPVRGPLSMIRQLHAAGEVDGAILAIGYRHMRRRQELFEGLVAAGIPTPAVVHPSATVDVSAVLGPGVVIFPGCVLDAATRVEANTVMNAGCTVAHDTRVGAHCFLGPGVTLSGFCDVGDRCFLGVGTVLIDNVRLEEDVFTAGGAVVVRNGQRGVRLAGVPARPMAQDHGSR